MTLTSCIVNQERIDTQHELRPELKVEEALYNDNQSQSTTNEIGKILTTNCWICEGWSQMKFEVAVPDRSIGQEIQSVWIHLEFEDYRPMVMLKKEEMYDEEEEDQESAARIAE